MPYADKEKNDACKARWYREHREASIASSLASHLRHEEARKLYMQKYAKDNALTRATYQSRWVERNRDKVSKAKKKWAKNNPDKVLNRTQRYRAKKRNNGPCFTLKEWLDLKSKYNHTCLRCGKQEPDVKLHADHVIPVSKGGPSGIDNIQPLCGPCNRFKRTNSTDYRNCLT